ncbi:MAG: hypothetical protein P8X42_15735 [Calditrichaceae bacterium]|jgi:hypothetical protein
MRKQHWFFVLFFVLVGMFLYAGNVTDFSGTWVLDESKIESGDQGPRMTASKLTVKQDEKQLTIERFISNSFRGDFTRSENVMLDGKETINKSNFGDRKLTASWSDDKKSLTINSVLEMNRNGQDFKMTGTEIWTLLDSGSVLKIDQTRMSPRGEVKNVLYYNKEAKNKDAGK